jgi:hypothetical protein
MSAERTASEHVLALLALIAPAVHPEGPPDGWSLHAGEAKRRGHIVAKDVAALEEENARLREAITHASCRHFTDVDAAPGICVWCSNDSSNCPLRAALAPSTTTEETT